MQKYFLHIFIAFCLVVLAGVVFSMSRFSASLDGLWIGSTSSNKSMENLDGKASSTPESRPEADISESSRVPNPETEPPASTGKIKADMFTGKLEKVDTGCFADGECFVEVDGKHVTVLMGWSRDTVGSVKGVDGFGDLENYIGKKVEVYAQEKVDGTYTLYGSEGFYVKVLDVVQAPAKPNVGKGCKIGGCSSQLCVEEDSENTMSTCEWTEAYACYRTATCEKQPSGSCGWTETTELKQCLMDAGSGAERI